METDSPMKHGVGRLSNELNAWVNHNFTKIMIGIMLIAIVVMARVLPHAPNFTPTLAVGLVAGVYFSSSWALVIGLGGYFISNLFLPSNSLVGSLIVVGAIAVSIILGRLAAKAMRRTKIWRKAGSVLLVTLASSVAFFLITNCNLLYNGYGMYPMNFGGLMESYVAGLPFFRTQLLGDLMYSGMLFGAMEAAHYLAGVLSSHQLADRN
ncbi:MAG: DUF6580 family putative transport protein [Candidatus Nanoperiomorbaceae bacterium]